MKPLLVESDQVVPPDGVERGGGGVAAGPELLAERKKLPFARFDVGRIVVALLHFLQHLLLAQRDFVFLKPRHGQHFAHDGETFIQVFGQHVKADAALGVADTGIQIRRQKRQALFQFFGGLGLDAAAGKQVTGQFLQPFFTDRHQIAAGPDVNHQVDQGKFAIRHHISHRSGFQFHAVILWTGRLVNQRRERQLFRTVRNGRRLARGAKPHSRQHGAHRGQRQNGVCVHSFAFSSSAMRS